MKNAFAWLVVLVLVAAFAALVWKAIPTPAPADGEAGDYAYRCDSGIEFSMTPASDMSSLRLIPGTKAPFAEAVLIFAGDEAGQRFEGNGLVFVGAGESVRLTAGTATINCQPDPDAEGAPFNFGDPGEGGGERPDLARIVGEGIVGRWASNEDAKFSREFLAGGRVVDRYVGEAETGGSWAVYTKETAVEPDLYPLEANAAYLRLLMEGTQGEELHFKVVKLTPESLELVYLGRGGALTFTRAGK
jgi:hypothetical protein